MIGIIGALSIEIEGLLEKMSGVSEESYSGITYVRGTLNGMDAVVAKCGIGKVNAAVCAQTMILKYRPKIIVNTGVAGAISSKVRIGDIIVATSVVYHDLDTTPICEGTKKGHILELDKAYIQCDPTVAAGLRAAAGECHGGIVASGDQFINCSYVKAKILHDFDATACEMEGAAIAHVCELNNMPFGIVRTISDNADDMSDFDFADFVKEAAKKSVDIISRWLADGANA